MIPPTQPQNTFPLNYSTHTQQRAQRALFCSPFELTLWVAMKDNSVPLPNIAGETGVQQRYTQKSISEQRVEKELLWLISVGILRREVDGQGITDSFRLTPLGRQLTAQWEITRQIWQEPSWWERLLNTLTRWFSLPF
ncbi:Npun_F0494 family protein [Aphanothece sacrum]|nr:Npun_F0494 family protein [Aphanothece sacrum]